MRLRVWWSISSSATRTAPGQQAPEHALGDGCRRPCGLPQVTVDSQGLMKVTHMLSLAGVGADTRGGHYASEADFQDSQRLAAQ